MKKNTPDQTPPPPDAADPSINSGQALRRLAEERLKARDQNPPSAIRNPQSEPRLVHELQVHQIELEMQNEELKQARAKADALLAQYTDLYDFAPTGCLTFDREGTIRQVNLTGALLLGVERSRLVNRRFGQFVAESDRRAFSDYLEKVFASEAKASCEVTLPQNGSQPLVVRIEGTRSADGQECRAMVLDITPRKQAEEALQAERQRLHNVLEVMPMMVCLLTPDYHVAFANRAFREKFGEAHGRRCYEYCFGKKRPCDFCESYEVLRTGKPHRWEVTSPDGATIIDAYDFPFTDVYGSPMILEVDVDITERKQAEATLAKQLDELRRWHQATLGREGRVLEVKQEVNALLARLGEPPRYPSAGEGAGDSNQ